MSQEIVNLPFLEYPSNSVAMFVNDPSETGIQRSKQLNFQNIAKLNVANTGLLNSKALANSSLTGTGSITAASANVTGVLSTFLSQIFRNDKITINGETRRLISVTSDILLVVDTPFTTTASGEIMTRVPGLFALEDSSGKINMIVESGGNVAIGTAIPDSLLHVNGPQGVHIQDGALGRLSLGTLTPNLSDGKGTQFLFNGTDTVISSVEAGVTFIPMFMRASEWVVETGVGLDLFERFRISAATGFVSLGDLNAIEGLHQNNGNYLQDVISPKFKSNITGDSPDFISVQDVVTRGNIGFSISSGSNNLEIWDYTNIDVPFLIGSLQDNTNFNGAISLALDGDFLYVASQLNDSVCIVKIKDLANPEVVGFTDPDPVDMQDPKQIVVKGNHLLVLAETSSKIVVVDVSIKTSPKKLYTFQPANGGNRPHDLVLKGNKGYLVTFGGKALTILDVSDLQNGITEINQVIDSTNLDGATGIDVNDEFAFVGSINDKSFSVWDITDDAVGPQFKVKIKNIDNYLGISSVLLVGDTAYMTCASADRLISFDVSNPLAPSQLFDVLDGTELNSCNRMSVWGKYLFISCNAGSRVSIFDITGIQVQSILTGSIYSRIAGFFNVVVDKIKAFTVDAFTVKSEFLYVNQFLNSKGGRSDGTRNLSGVGNFSEATDTLLLFDTSVGPGDVKLRAEDTTDGRIIEVKDDTGNASLNNIVVVPPTGQSIDNLPINIGITLKFPNESVTLKATNGNWRTIATNTEESEIPYKQNSSWGKLDGHGNRQAIQNAVYRLGAPSNFMSETVTIPAGGSIRIRGIKDTQLIWLGPPNKKMFDILDIGGGSVIQFTKSGNNIEVTHNSTDKYNIGDLIQITDPAAGTNTGRFLIIAVADDSHFTYVNAVGFTDIITVDFVRLEGKVSSVTAPTAGGSIKLNITNGPHNFLVGDFINLAAPDAPGNPLYREVRLLVVDVTPTSIEVAGSTPFSIDNPDLWYNTGISVFQEQNHAYFDFTFSFTVTAKNFIGQMPTGSVAEAQGDLHGPSVVGLVSTSNNTHGFLKSPGIYNNLLNITGNQIGFVNNLEGVTFKDCSNSVLDVMIELIDSVAAVTQTYFQFEGTVQMRHVIRDTRYSTSVNHTFVSVPNTMGLGSQITVENCPDLANPAVSRLFKTGANFLTQKDPGVIVRDSAPNADSMFVVSALKNANLVETVINTVNVFEPLNMGTGVTPGFNIERNIISNLTTGEWTFTSPTPKTMRLALDLFTTKTGTTRRFHLKGQVDKGAGFVDFDDPAIAPLDIKNEIRPTPYHAEQLFKLNEKGRYVIANTVNTENMLADTYIHTGDG